MLGQCFSIASSFTVLGSGTADEEPFVDRAVNRLRSQVLARRDRGQLVTSDTAGRVRDSQVGAMGHVSFHTSSRKLGHIRRDTAWLSFASDEFLPSLGAFMDDVHGIAIYCVSRARDWLRGLGAFNARLVLALAREGELVLGLSIGDLVDTEPLVGSAEETREVALNILDVVELGGQGILDVDDDDLPVSLLLVEQSHNTEDLDLLDLTGVTDELANLADIKRVVVTLGLRLGVNGVGVLPGLSYDELNQCMS